MNIFKSLVEFWPCGEKTSKKYECPPFTKVVFNGNHGEQYDYIPTKDITSYEVALLLPMFMTLYPMNRWPYIEKHNLMKHFKEVENETK